MNRGRIENPGKLANLHAVNAVALQQDIR